MAAPGTLRTASRYAPAGRRSISLAHSAAYLVIGSDVQLPRSSASQVVADLRRGRNG